MAAITNDGADVIARESEAPGEIIGTPTGKDAIVEKYEIDRCVEYILQNNKQRVALQFCDSLLVDSVQICTVLTEATQRQIVILADTSYGSCCVDEVAAEHYSADLIIHYGHSCLSKNPHQDVLFVFGKQSINIDPCVKALQRLIPDSNAKMLLLFDVVYNHKIDDILVALDRPGCKRSYLQIPSSGGEYSEEDYYKYSRYGRNFNLDEDGVTVEDYQMVYIGSFDSLTLRNFMLSFNQNSFYTYNPQKEKGRKETLKVSRVLMKRYYLVERAKEAHVIGILVGTLGVSNYLALVKTLRQLIEASGKKSYTFVMGKINVPKLANFMEIDMYCLVACPENSLIDSEEFYRPVITPFELELACVRSREWTGEYETDFQNILPRLAEDIEAGPEDADLEPEFSLVSGSYIARGVDHQEEENANLDVALRNQNRALVEHTAGSYFAERSFRGLELKLGETPVTKAVEGTIGVARGYASEPVKPNTSDSPTS